MQIGRLTSMVTALLALASAPSLAQQIAGDATPAPASVGTDVPLTYFVHVMRVS
ncbi:MAG: hypothetical protein H0V09_08250 [Gemmatimonadetes bacterium]|nr:hypothetical protein [Gemmatimonadota bacterium]